MFRKRPPFLAIFRRHSTSLFLIGHRHDAWALQHLLFSSRSSQSTSWKLRRVVVSFSSRQLVYLRIFFAGISSGGASGDNPARLCCLNGVLVLLKVRKASAPRPVLLITVVSWWQGQLISVAVDKNMLRPFFHGLFSPSIFFFISWLSDSSLFFLL